MTCIRAATKADVDQLAQVHVTCWHESYDGLVAHSVLGAFTLDRGREVWTRILGEPSAFNAAAVYLAELDRRIVGFASCGSQRTTHLAGMGYDGEISSIYLLRAVQRRGFGGALMRTLAADLIDRGCRAGSLWVLRDNVRARRFYESCGGGVVAERTDVRENTALFEVAYGWNPLAGLLSRTGFVKTHPAPDSGA